MEQRLVSSNFTALLSGKAGYYLGGLLLFGVVAVIKSPTLFWDPRFWAEEGLIFYQNCLQQGAQQCLRYVHLGNFLLFSNLLGYWASLVPAYFAPFVTTYGAAALHVLVVYQVLLLGQTYGIKTPQTYLLVTALALLPQTYEVWMTATNVQWLAGISVMLVFAMPAVWLRSQLAWLSIGIVLCGFAGIPSVILTPIALVRGILMRSKSAVWLATLLGACAVAQTAILIAHPVASARSFSFNLPLLGLAASLHTLIGPLLTVDFFYAVGSALRAGGQLLTTGPICLLAVSGLLMGLLATWGVQIQHRGVYLYLFCCWIFVTTIQAFAALDQPWDMVATAGGRYFLLGAVCFCLSLGLASTARVHLIRYVSTAMLTVVVLSGFYTVKYSSWNDWFLTGPSWREQIVHCERDRPCEVGIWPAGWMVTLPSR
ncbi:MAG: hypothetical protein ACFBSG_16085 [Leptolyngbyaceae cyanobacterium]